VSTPEIEIRRSTRRRTTAKAYAEGGRFVVEVPSHLSQTAAEDTARKLVKRLLASQGGMDDDGLNRRAHAVANAYLAPQVPSGVPSFTIRWVGNQNQRWGSCTPATGTIRISDRVRSMPAYVQDYVMFHELCHLVERTHGARFRALESAYPEAVRAKGYLDGYVAGAGWEPADG
jgi:predicted metal-dependent hydrolase